MSTEEKHYAANSGMLLGASRSRPLCPGTIFTGMNTWFQPDRTPSHWPPRSAPEAPFGSPSLGCPVQGEDCWGCPEPLLPPGLPGGAGVHLRRGASRGKQISTDIFPRKTVLSADQLCPQACSLMNFQQFYNLKVEKRIFIFCLTPFSID